MKLIYLQKLLDLSFFNCFNYKNILNLFKLSSLISIFKNGFNVKKSIAFVLLVVVFSIVSSYILSCLIKIFYKKNTKNKSKSSSFPKKIFNKLGTFSNDKSISNSSYSLSSSSSSSSLPKIKKYKDSELSTKLSKRKIHKTLRKYKIN